MNLETALNGRLKPHTLGQQIWTSIGYMLISLRDGHLFCNFYGQEERAKLIFGHWKVNKLVSSDQDIKNHLDGIEAQISKYRNCLKNGQAYSAPR